MSVTHGTIRGNTYGLNGTFGTVRQPKSIYRQTDDGYTITDTYRGVWVDWRQSAPSLGTPHSEYPYAALISRDASQIDPGILCDVVLTYEYKRGSSLDADDPDEPDESGNTDPEDRPSENPGKLPPNDRSENVANIQVPIEQHPRYEDADLEKRARIDDYFASPSQEKMNNLDLGSGIELELFLFKLNGVNHYIVPSVTETTTTYSWGYPGTVSDDIGEVTGAGKWLAVSGSVFRQGNYWAKQIIRQYSENGWPEELYGGE